MSTTLDEARRRLDEACRVKLTPYEANVLVRRIEALARAIFREEIAKIHTPKGGGSAVNLAEITRQEIAGRGDERLAPMRRSYIEGTNPPEFRPDPAGPYVLWEDAAATIADLQQRLAEAEAALVTANDTVVGLATKLNEARSSLETAERRIGELELAVERARGCLDVRDGADEAAAELAAVMHPSKRRRVAALTPDAGEG